LDKASPGDRLNFEVDMLGKYVEKLLLERVEAGPGAAAGPSPAPIDQGRMESWGYGV
jgi:hypothetical protein